MDELIDISPEDSVAPVYLVPLTEEEEQERIQWAIEEEQKKQAEQDAIAAKELARQSAMSKLSALGLTEEEAKAVIGL